MQIQCEVCKTVTPMKVARVKNLYYTPHVCSSECFSKLISQNKIKGKNQVSLSDIFLEWGDSRIKINSDVDHSMRSNYERGFEVWLKEHYIPFFYEPYKFTLESGAAYIPDFYLPFNKTFIEVKGLWLNNGWYKFKQFTKEFPFRSFLVDMGVMRKIGCKPATLTEVMV